MAVSSTSSLDFSPPRPLQSQEHYHREERSEPRDFPCYLICTCRSKEAKFNLIEFKVGARRPLRHVSLGFYGDDLFVNCRRHVATSSRNPLLPPSAHDSPACATTIYSDLYVQYTTGGVCEQELVPVADGLVIIIDSLSLLISSEVLATHIIEFHFILLTFQPSSVEPGLNPFYVVTNNEHELPSCQPSMRVTNKQQE